MSTATSYEFIALFIAIHYVPSPVKANFGILWSMRAPRSTSFAPFRLPAIVGTCIAVLWRGVLLHSRHSAMAYPVLHRRMRPQLNRHAQNLSRILASLGQCHPHPTMQTLSRNHLRSTSSGIAAFHSLSSSMMFSHGITGDARKSRRSHRHMEGSHPSAQLQSQLQSRRGRSLASTSWGGGDDDHANVSHDMYELPLLIETVEEMEEVAGLLSCVSGPPDCILLDGDLGAGKTAFSRGFITCKLGGESQPIGDDSGNGTDDGGETASLTAAAPNVRVTSPTYLLSNTYVYNDDAIEGGDDDKQPVEIHHMDLYRLSATSADEFAPLHLDYVFRNCISLIEWPIRLREYADHESPSSQETERPSLLPAPLPSNLLQVDIRIRPSTDERIMTLRAGSASVWQKRLQNLVEDGMIDDLLLDDEFDEDDD